jgi:hypothetical protein
MKRVIISFVFAGLVAHAQVPPPPVPGSDTGSRPRRTRMDASTRSNILAKAGGFIQCPNTESANFIIVNAQKQLPAQVASDAVGRLQRFLLFPFEVRQGDANTPPRTLAAKTLGDKKAAAVIVLCEAKEEPALLVAPEARWAIVNVEALAAGASKEVYAARVRKEIARAFGFIMGAAHSTLDGCVMKPVLKPEDLDKINVETVSPESLNKVMAQAKLLGIQPARMTTYRKAVEEGWAPMPTNAIQKAVWDEIKGKK